MKKIISILFLISFFAKGQTLVKMKQVGDGLGTGSIVVTGAANGACTYSAASAILAPYATTAALTSSYVPYTGATTSVNLGANSFSAGIVKLAEISVSSPSDGWLWHGPAPRSIIVYHSDASGATYNWSWANATRTIDVYAPATAQATTAYGVQFTTSDATGLGLSPNGNLVMGANTNSCVISNSVSIGKTTSPNARVDVNGSGSFSTSVQTPSVFGSAAAGGTLYIQSTSNATKGFISQGSSTGTTVINSVFGTASLTTVGSTVVTAGQPTLLVIGNASVSSNFTASGTASVGSTFTAGAGAKVTTTLTVGNTSTLTGGNSGTIAVLSDAVFEITFNPNQASLSADNTSYYFGNMNYPPQTFAATMGTVALPYNCKLVAWTFNYYLGGTVGSSENNTLALRVNNTTDVTLSSTITFNSATATGFSATGLSQSFTAGDRINAKLTTGALGTNPGQVYPGLTLFFARE